MSYIVDRRLNGKNKSAVNRQRFMKRYRAHIREAVNEAMKSRSIKDMERGENITIPRKDLSEPFFRHGPGGRRTIVHPGNKEFHSGDTIPRPDGGGGGGAGEGHASDQGEGLDDFVFRIDPNEFLNFLFEDLALPNLVKRQLSNSRKFRTVRAGVVNEGNPSRINIVRSMRAATMRRRALGGAAYRNKRQLEAELASVQEQAPSPDRQSRIEQLEEKLARVKRRLKRIPFVDTVDLRYNHYVRQPIPVSRAVMFCIMDVSGSMSQQMKDLAKRFFLLLYLFLQRNYEQTEVVFIRHHTSAREVDEEDFFYSRETGGTIVSSALKLTDEIIRQRYPTDQWNIYAAQASDGDNWSDDSPVCAKILREKLLPMMQYFAYVEIMPRHHQALWDEYAELAEQYPDQFALQQIDSADQIYPVFRHLFRRRMKESA